MQNEIGEVESKRPAEAFISSRSVCRGSDLAKGIATWLMYGFLDQGGMLGQIMSTVPQASLPNVLILPITLFVLLSKQSLPSPDLFFTLLTA